MVLGDASGLLAGAVALGVVHGVEPGHGWPVAVTYALDRTNKWPYGFAASLVLGVGHLVSSLAMVLAFFYAKAYFELTQINEPITVLGDLQIGGPVSLVAGVVLVWLGLREYRHGRGHGHDHAHGTGDGEDHAHAEDGSHGNGHDHAHSDGGGLWSRLTSAVPFVDGRSHSHSHSHSGPGNPEDAATRGLFGIAWFAFVLGFAHEEEFEIIALCAGSDYCLELMSAYTLTVIAGIVGLTMLLIAGYQRYEQRVERYTPYLPLFSATVLVLMGLGFVTGLL
jgi:ABC-type nickel/cobalt efflux system permease component RcnA